MWLGQSMFAAWTITHSTTQDGLPTQAAVSFAARLLPAVVLTHGPGASFLPAEHEPAERRTIRGDQGHLMLEECIALESESIRAIGLQSMLWGPAPGAPYTAKVTAEIVLPPAQPRVSFLPSSTFPHWTTPEPPPAAGAGRCHSTANSPDEMMCR